MAVDKRKSIFRFNSYNRHQWMAEMAKTVPAGSDVLDAGAGTGPYRSFFSHCNYKTQDFCKTPSTQGKYTEMNYVCDITNIPVPDESFDVVICSEVLEHVPEPIKAVEEFSRVLRQDGRLFITARWDAESIRNLIFFTAAIPRSGMNVFCPPSDLKI